MVFKKVWVIIPSLNPDEKLINTVNSLKKTGFKKFVIVDDGSDEQHREFFSHLGDGLVIIHHNENRGKGAALKTAFKYLLKTDEECLGAVSVDGDGQHLAEDVLACAQMLEKEKGRVILGCRQFDGKDVPKKSRFGNNFTKFVFKHICGMAISDTQTGLRAFPRELFEVLTEIEGDRFEYETNMFFKLKQRGFDFFEVPIKTVYIEENASTHFKPIRDSLRIYRFILSFMLSSLASFVVDIALFYILCLILKPHFTELAVAIATFGARVVSSITNYTINRKKVFRSHSRVGKSIFRYYLLAVVQMGVSAALVSVLAAITGSNSVLTTVIKAAVDTILFFISYRIQQNWVFSEREKPKKEVTKNKKSMGKKIVGRSLLVVITAIAMAVITALSTGFLIARGPSKTMRNMLVLSAKQASATKWLPRIFLSKETVDKIVEDSHRVNTDVLDTDALVVQNDEDEWAESDNGIKLEYITKPKFKAYMVLVKNPERVKVGVSSENYKTATAGMRVFDLADKYNAPVVINAGEFSDVGGVGNGSTPMGLTYSFGKLVWDDGYKRTFIGFNKENKLICRESMTSAEAERLCIRDAVCFQNGNVLIEQDGKNIKVHYSDKNTGTAQRTAIAQRADGTVIMLVTDGRSASSIGATRNDVIDILVEYGAVSAGMLDGGSSAMLYYKDYYDIYSVDKSKLDTYQLKGLVNCYKAFTNPRRIPTYFIVTEE